MDALFLWTMCGVIAGLIGSQKGQGCGGVVAGVLLGPFGILLILFTTGNRAKCRFCREKIDREATVCPRCQRDHPIL